MGHNIKQYNTEESVGYQLTPNKGNAKKETKLKFLYRQRRYRTPTFEGLSCIAIFQPHLDRGFTLRIPNKHFQKLKSNVYTVDFKNTKLTFRW